VDGDEAMKAFTLTSFDGVSIVAGINSQGSFRVPYDSYTVLSRN
jgi:hypothetical protein